MSLALTPIGHIFTPFTQKFGIPRQGAGLSIAKGRIAFAEHIQVEDACAGLSEFSHLWLLFEFHQHREKSASQKVRPPRLGGNKKQGVFATRSSFRPNGIGMSLVKNLGLHDEQLVVQGIDLLDQTPILDIKPYLVYSDCIEDAKSAYAQAPPSTDLTLKYAQGVFDKVLSLQANYPDLAALIENVICSDPRPAYKAAKPDEKQYFVRLYDIDIAFRIEENTALVSELKRV